MGLRKYIYKIGLRPSPGCVLYSPSLALIYATRDVDFIGAFAEGVRRGEARQLTVDEAVKNSRINQENENNGS